MREIETRGAMDPDVSSPFEMELGADFEVRIDAEHLEILFRDPITGIEQLRDRLSMIPAEQLALLLSYLKSRPSEPG